MFVKTHLEMFRFFYRVQNLEKYVHTTNTLKEWLKISHDYLWEMYQLKKKNAYGFIIDGRNYHLYHLYIWLSFVEILREFFQNKTLRSYV